jgi:SAM-dependent methyltransferase
VAASGETRVSGERVSTAAGGFNPTWQRHVAAYTLCAPLLPLGRVLDLGCGVGHSYARLAPRETIGLDIDPATLVGQGRETVAADMRSLPFADGSFAAVLSVQSLEHVPGPERVLAEARRILEPGGTAVFVTPNRLTFGPPEEIVDPYHHVEFSAAELRAACGEIFPAVELLGLFGSRRYLDLVAAERRQLDRVLRRDPLRLRRLLPRRLRQRLYDAALRHRRGSPDPDAAAIDVSDFELSRESLEEALDLVAVCRR